MTRKDMLDLMKADLKNEYTHMLFYLSHAAHLRGLHRIELREWLEDEADSEMGHVKAFSKLLTSFGEIALVDHNYIPVLVSPEEIIDHAIALEQEVVSNYALRLKQVAAFIEGGVEPTSRDLGNGDHADEFAAWTRAGLFYEDQLMHSHEDLDELRQWRRNFT
jgi:bacterioferritin (cytochrome b1)